MMRSSSTPRSDAGHRWSDMPLYYFDTTRKGKVHEDRVGVELEDASEAKLQACALLSDLAHEDASDRGLLSLTCDVRDAQRRVLYRATLTGMGRSA